MAAFVLLVEEGALAPDNAAQVADNSAATAVLEHRMAHLELTNQHHNQYKSI